MIKINKNTKTYAKNRISFVSTVSVLLSALLLSVSSPALSYEPAQLKNSAVIIGDYITLGDLFTGIDEEKSSMVLSRSPVPGKDITLNAGLIYKISKTAGVSWIPLTGNETITITRKASIVTKETIENLVADNIASKFSLDSDFDIETHTDLRDIILPPEYPASAEITQINFDPQKDWFQAEIAAPSSEKPLRKIAVNGKIKRIVQVPVLKTTMRNGDIIAQSDITYVSLYLNEVRRDYLLKNSELIGKTPQRVTFAGKPIGESDLEMPVLVNRGENVTLIYKTGILQLTAEGRALRNGAQGDHIKVVNSTSGKTVNGIVGSQGIVYVR